MKKKLWNKESDQEEGKICIKQANVTSILFLAIHKYTKQNLQEEGKTQAVPSKIQMTKKKLLAE